MTGNQRTGEICFTPSSVLFSLWDTASLFTAKQWGYTVELYLQGLFLVSGSRYSCCLIPGFPVTTHEAGSAAKEGEGKSRV